MELVAPCGAVATRRRNSMRYGLERNEASPSHVTEHNEPLPNHFVSLRVEEAFAADPALLGTRIAVEAFEGIVELSGIVRWQYQLSWAKQVAWRVGGVLGLRSYVRVAPSAQSRSIVGPPPCGADSGTPGLAGRVRQRQGWEDEQGPGPRPHSAST